MKYVKTLQSNFQVNPLKESNWRFLVKNWEKEFRRWLGRERITVFTADQVFSSHLMNKDDISHKICFDFSKIDRLNF